jgi:uncharacterized protein
MEMKATKAHIEEFLAQPHIAVAGYSRNPNKFGGMVYKTLREKGYDLYPVNPEGGETSDGRTVLRTIDELPDKVKALYIVTRPDITERLVAEAIEEGITHIWIQQMSDNAKIKEMISKIPVPITGECILMHTNPKGFHKFHWWLVKMIGRLPA